MEIVKQVLDKCGYSQENLIQILLELQNLSGNNYLPDEWVKEVAKLMNLPLSKVYAVVTFYAMFHTKPRGKYVIEVCKSGPCHVAGSAGVVHMLESELGIKPGETTKDGLFTIELSSCFGACDISPAIKIGEAVYGNLTVEKLKDIMISYREGR